MIVKMKFLSITGPQADIDRVVNQYLSKYEIHLENALSELKTVEQLTPFMEINPYREWLTKANEFAESVADPSFSSEKEMSLDKSIDLIRGLDEKIRDIRTKRNIYEEKREALRSSYKTIEPFLEFDYSIHAVLEFRFIKYRFGKISHEYYDKLAKYVYDDLDTVFYRCHSDENYVWGIYFVPASQANKIDAVYSSMHFERIYIPDDYTGTPHQAAAELQKDIDKYTNLIHECQKTIDSTLVSHKEEIITARKKLASLSTNFDVRRLAACTRAKNDHQVFYILCGWMTENDAIAFEKDVANDTNLYCILEDDNNNVVHQPPTKLKNPRLFKPFEMFVRMYGLPAYNEIDPTVFVGITYAFIFGAMFGDAGQGLCLLIGGYLLYHFKKLDLAAIVSCAGFFSTIFGLLFGSFFGFEDLIPALWLRPVDSMTTVPFIGKLNTVFIIAIGFGMLLILVTMVFHIINGMKAHDPENTWFDTNGLAGLVFYGAIVLILVLFMTGHTLPAGIVIALMFVIPLVLIALKEPLSKLVQKRADFMPKEKGMFIVQTVFEMFEVLLSYFSNTLSFVRIGAFAVSHAAMMEVVLMLAGAEAGTPNWIVIVLGNIFVCGMEGLIVGIQVLRLEYYEMFSRFYKGTGREFKPFAQIKHNK
ncbi:V-type ATP synthase subunit I [Murimonas intestini]|uniref:V/A-type H+-transporting ATPase subunit I n=1 Tax=Murimonas intestini TaxID=1337051 RepID=A0AB73SYC1_9FIRM|nr:V-type ATPase 116kDa subunit family protein [Murimonas intestini]MCR1840260.1 ATPase [Murimonas intestini]MCR1868276.1 ATPase [Murimonas intestini]MCR1885626.1 ATPase [Murimonas intestini]